jgi:hypothetical protein
MYKYCTLPVLGFLTGLEVRGEFATFKRTMKITLIAVLRLPLASFLVAPQLGKNLRIKQKQAGKNSMPQ